MASVNRVILVGRLGKDPELKSLRGGQSVCKFSLATDEQWKDKSGEKQERTEWHNVVAWGKLAEICGQYLTKGKQVYIDGSIRTETWEDKDTGQKRYRTEIIAQQMKMLGSKQDGRADDGIDEDGLKRMRDADKTHTDEGEEVPF